MDSRFAAVAIAAAQEAGALLQSMVPESLTAKQVAFKRNPSDLVTRADRMAEELIVHRLQAEFPEHGMLAEEGTRTEGAYRWIIDPLDGTTNFAHGVPWYAVSVALEHAGEVVVGVVYHPALDELFVAERSRGAWLQHAHQQAALKVSAIARVAEAIVTTGLPYDIRETGRNTVQIGKLARTAIEVRIMGSAALHLAYVAAGRVAAFWEPGLNPWDVAAGILLVQEAGGRVSDMDGGPFRLDCQDILATNGRIHDEMLAVLRS